MADQSEKTKTSQCAMKNTFHCPTDMGKTVSDSSKETVPFAKKMFYRVLYCFNLGTLITVFVFNGWSTADSSKLFVSSQSNQSDKYRLDITPAGWTFSIWGIIYTWQAMWVISTFTKLFRCTSQGPAYLHPPTCPPQLFIFYILANCCNIAWLFLFDRSYIEAAFAALILLSLFLIAALIVSYRALDQCMDMLDDCCGGVWEVRLTRGFIHNGLAIYATWSSIATLLNLAMVIAYSKGSDVSASTASTVALGVLTAMIVVFVGTDLLLLDRYSRWTITPYAIVVFALSGSLAKNYEAGATNTVFTIVLLAFASLFLVVKIAVTVFRHVKSPSRSRQVTSTLNTGL